MVRFVWSFAAVVFTVCAAVMVVHAHGDHSAVAMLAPGIVQIAAAGCLAAAMRCRS